MELKELNRLCVNIWKTSEAATLVFQWIFALNSVKHKFFHVSIVEKKIAALSVAAACLQFIKHNRNHSRVSNTKKRKCWIKPWLAIMDLFVLISMFATMWRRGGGLTGPKSGWKNFALILTLKHWSREPIQKRNTLEMHF